MMKWMDFQKEILIFSTGFQSKLGVSCRLRMFSQREWVFGDSRVGVAVVFPSATTSKLAE